MSLCECGHPEDEHRFVDADGPWFNESWCMAKVEQGNNRDFCPCNEFKQKENQSGL